MTRRSTCQILRSHRFAALVIAGLLAISLVTASNNPTTQIQLNSLVEITDQLPQIAQNYEVTIQEKLPDEILSIVTEGLNKESQTYISLYIQDESQKDKIPGVDKPDIECDYDLSNICNVPENLIVFTKGFKVLISITCATKCSYSIEPSYTKMREFQLDSGFNYFRPHSLQEDLATFQGWFSVPQNKHILQVQLTATEYYPNFRLIPITILLNPGQAPISGSNATHKSTQGVLNSAVLKLDQNDLKEAQKFSFVVNFAASSYIYLQLRSFDGGMNKLEIGDIIQDTLNPSNKMIYQLVNIFKNDTSIDNSTLTITVICQQGNALIKLAGKEIPREESDFIVTSQDDYFVQKIEITAKERKDLNLGNDLFYLQIEPKGQNYLQYEIATDYVLEETTIEELAFNIETHHMIEPISADHYQFVVYGEQDIEVQLLLTHNDGTSMMILKNCDGQLKDCQLSSDEVTQIIADPVKNAPNNTLIVSQDNKQHAISFVSPQSTCNLKWGQHWCIYYLAVINSHQETYRYSLLLHHQNSIINIKPNEFHFDSILQGQYRYYSLTMPPTTVGIIDILKLSISSTSPKTVIGVSLSSKSNIERPTRTSADISLMNDYLVIRRADYGELNDIQVHIFVYSEEVAYFNLLSAYSIVGQIIPKQLFVDHLVQGIINSYEDSDVYQIFVWKATHGDPDLKFLLQPIQGEYEFRFCKTLKQNTLSDCQWGINDQLFVDKSTFKDTQFINAFIEVIPLVPVEVSAVDTHNSLQYKFGLFLSTSLVPLSFNDPYEEYILKSEVKHFKLHINAQDEFKLQLTSSSETAKGSNVKGYLSFNHTNTLPNATIYSSTLTPNVPVNFSQNQTQSICEQFSKLKLDCEIYLTLEATLDASVISITASKSDEVVKLRNKIKHIDQYPIEGYYHRYYIQLEKDSKYILEVSTPSAKLDIYVNFIATEKKQAFFADDQTVYPREDTHDYQLGESVYWQVRTIDFDNTIFSNKNNTCYSSSKCFVAVSIRVHPSAEINYDNLSKESYSIKLFTNNLPLIPHERSMFFIKKDQNVYFTVALPTPTSRYILHITPVGICEITTIVTKLGITENNKHSYSEPGGSFISIDRESQQFMDSVQGNYLITITTQDDFCAFYVVGYDTPYQYVRVEPGHYFHSNLKINELLFLEYEHGSNDPFEVQTSLEEGTIILAAMHLKDQWSPSLPLIQYDINNLKNLHKHTLTYGQSLQPCKKCKYIIAVGAVRESRLSIVIKSWDIYTVLPAQRMVKVEASSGSYDLVHFFPHSQAFSIQLTLIYGKVKLSVQEGYAVDWKNNYDVFTLATQYSSQSQTYKPSSSQDTDEHSQPFSFRIEAEQDSVYVISAQSQNRTMHLASGFPYFTTVGLFDTATFQYQALSGDYQKTTEFSIYFLDDIYKPEGNSKITKAISDRFEQIRKNETETELKVLSQADFYPSFIIEDEKLQGDFQKEMLFEDAMVFSRESKAGVFRVEATNDQAGLIELNQSVSFYIIPHSGMQHLFPNKFAQKKSFQGSSDQYEFFALKNKEVVFELTQCYGFSQLALALSEDAEQTSLTQTILSISSNHNVLKISSANTATSNSILDYNNFIATVYSQQPSQYRLKVNSYPKNTVYPAQIYSTVSIISTKYNFDKKELDVNFNGLICSRNCESDVFQLYGIEYVFDSDYFAMSNAQGKALCESNFLFHLKSVFYDANNITYSNGNFIYVNDINHENLLVSIDIDSLLDKDSKKYNPKQLYLSFNARAFMINKLTKQFEVFNFPHNTITINVETIEKQKGKLKKIALIILFSILGTAGFVVLAIYLYKLVRKARRTIRFEMQDAQNISTMSQPSAALRVNLNELEMNKYTTKYTTFQDEEVPQDAGFEDVKNEGNDDNKQL